MNQIVNDQPQKVGALQLSSKGIAIIIVLYVILVSLFAVMYSYYHMYCYPVLWYVLALSIDCILGVMAIAMLRRSITSLVTTRAQRIIVDILLVLPVVVILVFISELSSYIYMLFRSELGMHDYANNLVVTVHGSQLLTVLLLIQSIMVAPIAEELFFRGLLLTYYNTRYGLIWGLLIQAILFALMHFWSILFIIQTFLIGIALGLLVIWRKNLVTAILVHMLSNSLIIPAILRG
jgi:membrane protease YdiL (CAAX protease family)